MESIVSTLRGYARFDITGAKPERLLNLMSSRGIIFWKASPITDYRLSFTTSRADAKKIRQLASKSLCTVNKMTVHGVPELASKLRQRYTLLLGFAALMMALLFSAFHIWDIEIYGNENVSRARILNALEECGVGIGSYWPDFVIDNIRSEVLVRVPELSYLTVNVYGSRAEIIVRERVKAPELVQEKMPVNVVAKKAGIITRMSVYRGSTAVKEAQTVVPGDVLVSAEVMSPLAGARFVHAMADVEARTWYELTAVRPATVEQKAYTGEDKTYYSIKIGEKKINFPPGSRIDNTLYDKIIREQPLSVWGLFTLPVTLIAERFSAYEIVRIQPDAKMVRGEMEEELMRILEEQLGAEGELVHFEFTALEKDGYILVTLCAECVENIAVPREIK